MSVSSPLTTESLHVGARHTEPAQTALPQSDAEPHFLPGLQRAQLEPPQSTSDSP
jgi:hypothetical protein